MKIPFIGQSNSTQSQDVDYQLSQNWYPSIEQTGVSNIVLYPTPGLTLFGQVGVGPIRGMIKYGDLLYVVSGSRFYEVSSTGVATFLGTLSSTEGTVGIAHNGSKNGMQICIVDGIAGYIYNSSYNTFSQIKQYATGTTTGTTANKLVDSGATFVTSGVVAGTIVYNTTDSTSATVTAVDSETQLSVSSDIFVSGENYTVGDSDFPDKATHVVFIDGYFVVNDPDNSGRFYVSDSYDGTAWGNTSFATAERSPDELVAVHANGRELWLLGEETIEVWYNAGTTPVPFAPMGSGYIEIGCAAKHSPASYTGIMFWLSSSKHGDGVVMMSQGMSPRPISNSGITNTIRNLSRIDDAIGYVYEHNDHVFYVLNFPEAGACVVYDLTTQMWHEWTTKDLGHHRCFTHQFFNSDHIVGDYLEGKLYKLDYDVYTDNGTKIVRKRRSQYMHANGKDVFHRKLEVLIAAGVGDNTTPDPMMIMRYSDDRGHTWSSEQWRHMGDVGEYNQTLVWQMLGKSKQRVYEITVTDPVNATIIDAFTEIKLSKEEISQ